ncbi:glycosyltransferase family 2 protein, partial [Escherichia coli]|nr:glycosyltransferase [Escherichia coli]
DVSVVIPVYNCGKTIKETINSILIQTGISFEIIVIDDGSNDETARIVNEICDERIKYFYQNNSGISVALNNGIKRAAAKYIARIDGDDIALPTRLETQFYMLESNPDVAMVASAVEFINDDGIVIGRSFPYTSKYFIRDVLSHHNIYAHPSVMFRKKTILSVGGYNSLLSGYCEDYYLWMQIIKLGKIINVSVPLTQYRISSGQITDWQPSKNYYKVMNRIINSKYIDVNLVNKLAEIKQLEKEKCKNKAVNNIREEIIKKNIFNLAFNILISFRVSRKFASNTICICKNITTLMKVFLT